MKRQTSAANASALHNCTAIIPASKNPAAWLPSFDCHIRYLPYRNAFTDLFRPRHVIVGGDYMTADHVQEIVHGNVLIGAAHARSISCRQETTKPEAARQSQRQLVGLERVRFIGGTLQSFVRCSSDALSL